MSKPRPLTEAEKKKIRTLHATGMSRNKIAKQLGRPFSTVSNFCVREGLTFDGTLPAAMIEARAISVKDRQVAARERKLLLDELYDARVLANLRDGTPWVTRQKTQGGGEQFVEVPIIPSDDYRNSTSAAASNASAFRSYAPLETGMDTAAAESVVDSLLTGFRTVYNAVKKPVEDESGDK